MKNKYILASFLGLFLANNVHAATLNLTPSQTTLANDETITVDVLLDTEGANIDGVDLYSLRFDPQIFTAVVIPGSLMPNTVYNQVDEGTIQFSQVTAGGTTFNGKGKLATIILTAKTAGSTSLDFDFVPGSTVDTNVASEGEDVLTSVSNTSLTVVSENSLLSTVQSLISSFIMGLL